MYISLLSAIELGEFMLIFATVNPSLAINMVKTLQGYSSHSYFLSSVIKVIKTKNHLGSTEQPGCFQRTQLGSSRNQDCYKESSLLACQNFPCCNYFILLLVYSLL